MNKFIRQCTTLYITFMKVNIIDVLIHSDNWQIKKWIYDILRDPKIEQLTLKIILNYIIPKTTTTRSNHLSFKHNLELKFYDRITVVICVIQINICVCICSLLIILKLF